MSAIGAMSATKTMHAGGALGQAFGRMPSLIRRWMRTGTRAALLAATLAIAATPPARAGRTCEEQPMSVAALQRSLALASATARRLDASGAQVVVLARAGQDLSRYGLQWSHLGFAYRSGDGTASYWRVVHKLNHCGTDEGQLYRQGLGEFFSDTPFRYEAAFVVLSNEAQARLLPLLQDNTSAAQLHERRYNMLAYPWAQTYQQSNQWALETLALAMEPGATSRQRAQSWLQFKGYVPSVLSLGPLTRLGARISRANVAFDDHPNDKRYADHIETVTVDSIFAWLSAARLAEGQPVVVKP